MHTILGFAAQKQSGARFAPGRKVAPNAATLALGGSRVSEGTLLEPALLRRFKELIVPIQQTPCMAGHSLSSGLFSCTYGIDSTLMQPINFFNFHSSVRFGMS